MNKLFSLVLILLSITLNGCWSYRHFDAEKDNVPIFEHWTVIFRAHDSNSFSQGDHVNVDAIVSIEKKFLDEDTLKNEAVRVDSLELVAGDSVYKRINGKNDFEYARKNYNYSGYRLYSNVFQLIDEHKSYDYYPFPIVPRDIKEIYVIAYVSVKHPEDGRIESGKVKMKLTENAETKWF